ncbi:hypothetical protein [Streptomyces sp. LN500]|uniref:hypothetical protein n=1 Tax=Streptomyces sp. LN500 TaxID=3112978 RepID=UPI0037244962
MTFHADHTFTSEDFDKLPVASDCSHPSDLSSGRWAFYSETSSDETASRGTMLSLTFSADGCRVDTYLFGDEDDPSMCPTADPDEACDS